MSSATQQRQYFARTRTAPPRITIDEPVWEAGRGCAQIELPGPTAAYAYLRYDEEGDVELGAYPADTLTQARAFYPDAEAVARVRALAADDSEVHPNFHFGFPRPGARVGARAHRARRVPDAVAEGDR